MIYWQAPSEPSLTDWLQAVGTIGAVAAALFFFFWERIRNWWVRPILAIKLNFRPPDCHHITASAVFPTGIVINYQAFWLRLTVKNRGKTTAKELEAIVSGIQMKTGETWKTYSAFLQNSLEWTHIRSQNLPLLLPGITKNVDLGHILEPRARDTTGEENSSLNVAKTETEFCFQVTAVPTNKYHIIAPGEYRFLVTVGGSNCVPVSARFKLTLTGKWYDDEDLMLAQGVKLSEA